MTPQLAAATASAVFVPQPVAAWRYERLREAGLAPPVASRIAADGRYDAHKLIDLLERGCPPQLAVRIVAPLDAGGARS